MVFAANRVLVPAEVERKRVSSSLRTRALISDRWPGSSSEVAALNEFAAGSMFQTSIKLLYNPTRIYEPA